MSHHVEKILLLIILTTTSVLSLADPYKTVDYLRGISGSYMVSGQHNDQKDGTNESFYTRKVFDITGKHPALYSGDMLFHGDSNMRWAVAYEAERQWNAGAMINIMWHACPPTQGAVCQWDGGLLSKLSDAQWNDLISDGGNLNRIWKLRIDEISVYLTYLKNKNVEVLWRPFHEMNQSAFWWGGRTGANGSRRLYQLTRDYMVNVKGLTNLIWVWNVQDLSTNYGDYNPGVGYWDVGSLDIYGPGYSDLRYYNALLAQSAGKPIGIGESFKVPNATDIHNMPRMSFFMVWSYGLQQNNSDQQIKDTYYHPRVVNRDEMPGWDNIVSSSSRSSSSSSSVVANTIYIQAENYSNMSGVAVETTTDSNGGAANVGWIDAGDWMSYSNIAIPASGTYTVGYRVASLSGGGQLQFEKAGTSTVYGTITIPATGGWQTWTTIYQTVTLSAGVQSFGIKALGGGWNINWISLTPVGTVTSSSSSVRSSSVSSSVASSRSSTGSLCTSPQYVDGRSYANGALVQNLGNEYRCTVGGWCTIGGPYAPGAGWAWVNAWSLVRSCR